MSASKHFVVIGLGSFGTALARRLCRNHCRVSGLDSDKERVEELKDLLYEAVIGDGTEREVLEHLPLAAASAVFVSLGEDITPSLLATLHARELGARRLIAKGVTVEHGKILKRLGVEEVVFPEIEVAETWADRVTWPNMVDLLRIDPEYSFMEMAVPDTFAGQSLLELDLRRRFGIWVVGVKDALSGKLQMIPGGDFRLGADQLLLLIGRQADLQKVRDAG